MHFSVFADSAEDSLGPRDRLGSKAGGNSARRLERMRLALF